MKVKIESAVEEDRGIVIEFSSPSLEKAERLNFRKDMTQEEILRSIGSFIADMIKQSKADTIPIKAMVGKEFKI